MNSPTRKAVFLLATVLAAVSLGGTPPADDERARNILQGGIESKDPQIRLQAVIASSMIGSTKPVIERIGTALTDDNVEVRIAAANALADLKSHDSIPALQKTLHDDEVPEVAFAAAKALYALQDPEGRAALEDVYDGKRRAQSNALRKQTRDFLARFHSVRSSFMAIVSQGIGFAPVPGAGAGFSAVSELLSDPELTPRATVVLMIGNQVIGNQVIGNRVIGSPRTARASTGATTGRRSTAVPDPQSTELLTRALFDREWPVRAAAVQCIAQTARKDLQHNLLPLLDDSKEKVRFRAAGAYLHLSTAR